MSDERSDDRYTDPDDYRAQEQEDSPEVTDDQVQRYISMEPTDDGYARMAEMFAETILLNSRTSRRSAVASQLHSIVTIVNYMSARAAHGDESARRAVTRIVRWTERMVTDND